MNCKINFLVLLSIVSAQVHSLDLKINYKDGSQKLIPTDSILKMTIAPDKTHALVIQQNDNSYIDAILTDLRNMTFTQTTQAGEPEQNVMSAHKTFSLHQNYPNPFNCSTSMEYELFKPAWIEVQIYNMSGQLVRTLECRHCAAGLYRTRWDGENDDYQLLANGVYFARVKVDDSIQVTKLLLVK